MSLDNSLNKYEAGVNREVIPTHISHPSSTNRCCLVMMDFYILFMNILSESESQYFDNPNRNYVFYSNIQCLYFTLLSICSFSDNT